MERYHAAGVPLNGLYADEMHIQQDWGYHSHHDEGQLTFRYLTPHLAARYAELVYFGQWFSPLREALDAFMNALMPTVTGDVTLNDGEVFVSAKTGKILCVGAGLAAGFTAAHFVPSNYVGITLGCGWLAGIARFGARPGIRGASCRRRF